MSAPATNSFLIPEAQFRSQVERIALAPVAVPASLGVSESAKLRFDALIQAQLQQAGFVTFPAKEWNEIFARMREDVGGPFDPQTGDLDDAKVEAIQARTVAEVRSRFDLDAILLPLVATGKADFASGRAQWDGTAESLASGLSVLAASEINGSVPALSLDVSIYTADFDQVLYNGRGGIQVLERLAPVTDRFTGKWLEPVPAQELLADDERNRDAIALALGPLLEQRAAR